MSVKRKLNEDERIENERKRPHAENKHFRLHNREKFNLKFPFFRKPSEIGSFSLDIKGQFCNTKQSLKFYVKPSSQNVEFDLRQGYDTVLCKDENEKGYGHLLRWILLHPDRFTLQDDSGSKQKQERNLHTDFVCWRGYLTKLLCTPYENRDDWKFGVTLYNGTYYINEYDTDSKIHEKKSQTERQKEMCCWGWKFEQYLTADTPDGKPDTQCQYNNIEAFVTVIRSRLNKHSIVFGGEVDAIQIGPDGTKSYVEFKSSREITHPRQQVNFKRYKLIKWWAQSYLVGISDIVCGYRDDDGIVHRLETHDVQKLPDTVKDIRDPWRPNICFNFLDQFLQFVKDTVKVDNPRVVHLFEWSPGRDVTCMQLPEDSEYCFLPEWYINPTDTALDIFSSPT